MLKGLTSLMHIPTAKAQISLIRAFAVRVQNHQILENTPIYLANALIRIRGFCRLICIFTVCICPQDILPSNAAHLSVWVAPLDAPPTGNQEVAGSTPTRSTTFFRGDLIMKYFLWSFASFRWFKKDSCQFLAKECAQYLFTAWRTKPAQ